MENYAFPLVTAVIGLKNVDNFIPDGLRKGVDY